MDSTKETYLSFQNNSNLTLVAFIANIFAKTHIKTAPILSANWFWFSEINRKKSYDTPFLFKVLC